MNNERSLAKEITEGFEALKSMRNNEPVAWMYDFNGTKAFATDALGARSFQQNPTPLYTHPVKTLTDEEILEVGMAVTNLIDSNEGWIEFARAILRKAQEK